MSKTTKFGKITQGILGVKKIKIKTQMILCKVFLGCRLPFLASESGSLPKYTNKK
jgi:hypothetical protein